MYVSSVVALWLTVVALQDEDSQLAATAGGVPTLQGGKLQGPKPKAQKKAKVEKNPDDSEESSSGDEEGGTDEDEEEQEGERVFDFNDPLNPANPLLHGPPPPPESFTHKLKVLVGFLQVNIIFI